MSISPAITTGIICSEYKNETNQFIFISKNSDFNSTEDYHLNIYNNSNKTMLRPMPLTKIKNYPNATSLHFGGLCSYAASQSSLYLNFEESTATNSTTTLVYQLQLDNTTSLPLKFEKKALELFDATLSSFLYAAGANDTSNLAYISTSKNRQNSLNLINLDHPRHHSTKNISDFGLLAVGGTKSQSLYFIQSNAVDVYKLDSLQYSHSAIQTNMTLQGLRRGTTGHVFSNNNFTKEYISIYHPNTGQVDIFDIDTLLIKYTPASVSKKGYIDLNTNTTSTIPSSSTVPSFTTLPSSATTSNTVTQPSFASRLGGTIDKRDDTDNQSKRSQLKVFSNKFYLKKGAANKALHKRAVEYNDGNVQSSSDGAIRYRTSQVLPDNGGRLPQAALLVPGSGNDDIYDYALFSDSGDSNQFTVSTEPSRRRVAPLVPTSTSTATSTPTPALDASSSDTSNLGGGAIAGIVISVIAFIAIIAGILFYSKKRKHKAYNPNSRGIQPEMSALNSATPISVQPQDFTGAHYSGGITVTRVDDNHTSTSSILQASVSIPEEYYDDSRPDIRPLSYNQEIIDYAHLSNEELLQLEPDVLGPLFLFSGSYISSDKEKVSYLRDGYAIRTFEAKNNIKHTVHYFSASHLDTFVRSVYAAEAVSQRPSQDNVFSKRHSLVSPSYVIKSDRAIVLNSPTPQNEYQYIWITSPMIPKHSLHHLLFQKSQWTFIDYNNSDYKIWSIYSILKSVESMHSHKLAHLAIDLRAFYFDHEMKATDWRLGNLGYTRSKIKPRGEITFPSVDTQFTAPEIIQRKAEIQIESVDIWSLGCVIYTVATGGLLLFEDAFEVERLSVFHDDMKQHVKIKIRQNIESNVFRNILEMMLQVNPSDRKSINEILNYWDSIYNMEE